MKKTLLIIATLLSGFAFDSSLNAQTVSKGNVIIDPYYGGPNFDKFIEFYNTTSDAKIIGIGGPIVSAGLSVKF